MFGELGAKQNIQAICSGTAAIVWSQLCHELEFWYGSRGMGEHRNGKHAQSRGRVRGFATLAFLEESRKHWIELMLWTCSRNSSGVYRAGLAYTSRSNPHRISPRLRRISQRALVMITQDTHELRMNSRDAQFNYLNPKGLLNHHIEPQNR